jgi:periplasmic protein CpxP/Spy
MKSWIKRITLVSLGTLVAVTGLAACTHRGFERAHNGITDTELATYRERVIGRATRKLDLDATQQAKLAILFNALAAQRTALNRIANTESSMQSLLVSEKFDRKKAQTLVDDFSGTVNLASPTLINATADFYDSLKPEQQATLRRMLGKLGA